MENLKKPPYFYCYLDNGVYLEHLSDEQAGILWKSLFEYANNGERCTSKDPVVQFGFDVFKNNIDRDFERYHNKCEKNRANASKRKRPLTNVSQKSQEKEKEEEKEKSIYNVEQDSTSCLFEIKEIVDYLNTKAGTSYRHTTKNTQKHIKARLKENYTVADFKKVIDSRVEVWGSDKGMRQYLRPDTLFGTKFESYLNNATVNKNKDNDYGLAGYEVFE